MNALTKIIKQNSESNNNDELDDSIISQSFQETQDDDPNRCVHNIENKDKFLFFVQYRGKCTEEYARSLHKLNAPCRIVMTLRKLKTVLPSLKPPVEKIMRSNVVYKITCPRCQSCYVGQTKRQLQRRFTEHLQKGPVKIHTAKCNVDLDPYCDIQILGSTSRGEKHLMTLEALFQKDISPSLNTKEEYKSRTLSIKF